MVEKNGMSDERLNSGQPGQNDGSVQVVRGIKLEVASTHWQMLSAGADFNDWYHLIPIA